MTTLTKTSKTRWTQHLPSEGISVSVDVSNPQWARVTLSVCNSKDRFSRKAARFFLNLRFDGEEAVLNSLNMKRNVSTFPYRGNMPKRDILIPLMDTIRNHLGLQFDSESKVWYSTRKSETVRVDHLIRLVRHFAQSFAVPSTTGGITGSTGTQVTTTTSEALDNQDIAYFEKKISSLTSELNQAARRLSLLKQARVLSTV